MDPGDGDTQYFCCGRCRGLWTCLNAFRQHKEVCVGVAAAAGCSHFACMLPTLVPQLEEKCAGERRIVSAVEDGICVPNCLLSVPVTDAVSVSPPDEDDAIVCHSRQITNYPPTEVRSSPKPAKQQSFAATLIKDDPDALSFRERKLNVLEVTESTFDVYTVIMAQAENTELDCDMKISYDDEPPAQAEDAPVEDAPVDDAPVEDAPVEDAPVEDAPVEDAPVEDAPTSAEKSVSGESRADKVARYVQHLVLDANGEASIYKCPTCGWETRHVGFFSRHLETAHAGGGGWRCEQCEFTCGEKRRMRLHALQHDRPWMCELCSKRYAGKRDLQRHMWLHNGEYPYCCENCDYKTRFPKALKEHSRKHTGDRLVCDTPGCDFVTAYAFALSNHRAAKHSEDKRYGCELCAYRTSDRGSMQKHVKVHAGTRDFACSECDYRAVSRHDVVRHQRRHTKEKHFFCDQCSYATSHASALRVHLMVHAGTHPWACAVCAYTSVTRAKVTRHARQRHAGTDPTEVVVRSDTKLNTQVTPTDSGKTESVTNLVQSTMNEQL